ncbi:unnamed protein product [Caenorhabditis brenneri]
MTSRKRLEPQNCISVIDNLQEKHFAERLDDVSETDFSISLLTSIWKHPERLSIESDYSLLLTTLCREVRMENYIEPLQICKIMKKISCDNRNTDKIFEFLLMVILKEEKKKKIDLHVILDWLDTGDREFRSEMITDKSYAILKLYFLCRNRKAKLECFSCGCVQKYFVDLFQENRFMIALNSLITSKNLDLHPIVKKLFKSMPEISTLEYFEYYVDLLKDLQDCSAIDQSNEKKIQRLVQLIGLLSELKLEDIPRACSELNTLFQFEKNNDRKKKSSLVESALRTKLLPKIFDSITTTPSVRINLTGDLDSVTKMAELVAREDRYSNAQQAAVIFSPLQLLAGIYAEFEVWEKTSLIIKSRLASLKMDTPQSPVVVLYVLKLIYQNDSSMLGLLMNHLENEYKDKTVGMQNRILNLLKITEKLGEFNSSFHSFFKENRLRKRLIMESGIEITLEYLNDFSALELNQFLQQKSFSDSELPTLVEKLQDTEFMINSDGFWASVLERIDQNSITFIENQLKILLNRQDGKLLNSRIEQLFKAIKSIELKEKSTDLKEKPMELLLIKFPEFLLNLEDSQYSLLPQNTTISLFSVLIFAFCTIYEGNENEISRQFRIINSKINKTGSSDLDFPLGSIEKISEKIRSRQIHGQPDHVLLSKLFEAKPENAHKKERVLEVASLLFEKLAADFQRLGDTNGKMPFCQICNIIVDYVKKSMEVELISNFQIFQDICMRVMEGFSMWTEQWNWLFVSQKIITILTGAKKQDMNLFRTLMKTLNKNQALVTKLNTKKAFLELESM